MNREKRLTTTASSPASSQLRKSVTPATTSGPNTRNNKSTSVTLSSEVYQSATEKIQTIDDAVAALQQMEVIPQSGAPSGEALITGLLHLAIAVAGGRSAVATEGLIAFSFYAKAVLEEKVGSSVISAVLTRYEAKTNDLADKLKAHAEAKIHEVIADLRHTATAIEEKTSEALRLIEETAREAGKSTGTGASSQNSPPFSFADAVRSGPPGAERAAQIRVADRESIRARQVLVDGFPVENNREGGSSEELLLSKANEAILFMRGTQESIPEELRFTAAKVLRNKGVILELPTPEMVDWLYGHAAAFEEVLGTEASIRPRPFKVVAEFVPVGFNPQVEAHWRQVEESTGVPKGAIVDARWIKPIEKRHKQQRFAHLLVTVNHPGVANKLIRAGLTLAGKHVSVRKNLAEPMRCSKCHRYNAGHLARDCQLTRDICGTCGKNHKTSDCLIREESQFRCANCNVAGHATWDRECPVFLEQRRRMEARHPENGLRFFPTSDPDSWIPRMDGGATLWDVIAPETRQSARHAELASQESTQTQPARPSQREWAKAAQRNLTQTRLQFAPQSSQPYCNDV